jgi:hypothetical protein
MYWATVWATFFIGKSYVLIIKKMGWAKVLATFSQTHPVTLCRNARGDSGQQKKSSPCT